jgi:regulatory protein
LVALKHESSYQSALSLALNYLTPRSRSQMEIRRYLQQKEFAENCVVRVLAKLEDMHAIDDRAFAISWIQSRVRVKPKSSRALSYELQQKGISAEIITETIADNDDIEMALKAGRTKASLLFRTRALPISVFQTRLSGFLQYRGFSYATIRQVVTILTQEYFSTENASQDFKHS